MYTPRSIRRLQQKSRRNFIFAAIGIVIFFYLFLTWGLPSLIGSLSIINQKKVVKEKQASDEVTLAPPVLNIPFEATNSSALKVSGFTNPKSKVDIYLDDVKSASAIAEDDGRFTAGTLTLSVGENYISGKTIDEKGVESLSSKPIKVLYDNQKPKLDLSEPSPDKEIKGGDKKVTVQGTTDPGNSVTVNSSIVIVNPEGAFSIIQDLQEGDNEIVVSASDSYGNTSEVKRKVKYTP